MLINITIIIGFLIVLVGTIKTFHDILNTKDVGEKTFIFTAFLFLIYYMVTSLYIILNK